MITEQDVRGIYDGFYKVAELVGEPDTTHTINYELHLLLNNLINPTTDKEVAERCDLIRITRSLETEYYPKFEELRNKQTLEVTVKWRQ